MRTLMVAAGLCALLAVPTSAAASVGTDQSDYTPGSTVTISGNNSDGAGYEPGEQVVVSVSEPEGATSCEATADFSGAWSCQITLAANSSAVGSYSYTAEGQLSHVTQSGSFTDSNCPDASSLPSHTKENPQIKASFTTSGGTATYSFTSPSDNPVKGVPGLLEYCVYTEPQPSEPPDEKSVKALYGDWQETEGGSETEKPAGHGYFNFERKGGTSDNVPFDGTTQTMGTATWSDGKVPTNQIILCHINEPGGGKTDSFVRCFGPAVAPTAEDPTATKTAEPEFTRKFTWEIEKAVNTNRIETSGTATFKYTVTVSHDSGTDSGWTVNGVISVDNGNEAPITGVNVTDAINDAHASCNVTGGTAATLVAEGVTEFGYTCTYSAAPGAEEETNTATISWPTQTLSNGASLTAGSTTAEAAVDWATTNPTIEDGSVEVTDTLGGPLGTVSYTEPSPTEFHYEKTFPASSPGTCQTYDNTATATTNTTGTEHQASQTVEVCAPEACHTVQGAGHFGPRIGGQNLNNNLSNCPGVKEQFLSKWNSGTEKFGLVKLLSVSVVDNATEKKLCGHGTATLNGVKGYEVTFCFTQLGPKVWDVDFTIEKGGVVVREFHLDPLDMGKNTPTEKFI